MPGLDSGPPTSLSRALPIDLPGVQLLEYNAFIISAEHMCHCLGTNEEVQQKKEVNVKVLRSVLV